MLIGVAVAVVVALVGGWLFLSPSDDPGDPVALVADSDGETSSTPDQDGAGDGTDTAIVDEDPLLPSPPTRVDAPLIGAELAAAIAGVCSDPSSPLEGAPPAVVGGFNDIVDAIQIDGGDVTVDPDGRLRLSAPPSLVRCTTQVDADVIEVCDDYTNDFTYTRITTDWSVRLVSANDGETIGSTAGSAQPEPCPDELVSYDDTRDFFGRAPVPLEVGDALAADYLAPHPSFACRPDSVTTTVLTDGAPGVDAVYWYDEATRVAVPPAWQPTASSPLSIGLCVRYEAVAGEDGDCATVVTVTAKTAADELIGDFVEVVDGCDWEDATPAPSSEFLLSEVGPNIGHPRE